MSEKAEGSSLQILVGKEVSSVCFVSDYVQVMFDDLVLTCYTLPSVSASDGQTKSGDSDYRDKLCGVIGRRVESVAERLREELAIYFVEGDSMSVSLRGEDAVGPEAAMLHQPGGAFWEVWHEE